MKSDNNINNYENRKDKRRKHISSKVCNKNRSTEDRLAKKISKAFKRKKNEIKEDQDWQNWQDLDY